MSFNSLALPEALLNAISAQGYTEPTEIQAKAIPKLIDGDLDFVGQAQTGTGAYQYFDVLQSQQSDCLH